MSHRIKYKIIPELKVAVEYYEGQISLNDIIEFELSEMENSEYRPTLNFVADFRNAELIAAESDVKKFVDFLKKTEGIIDQRKVALVTDTPNQVVLTTLYALYTSDMPVKNKVFSTLDAAMKWLEIKEENYDLIIGNLEELKNTKFDHNEDLTLC
jgi:hypothetical protein